MYGGGQALLLGSDYTEGVAGIGIVNAMEIVLAWGGSLEGFKDWVDTPDGAALLQQVDMAVRKGRKGKGKAAERAESTKVSVAFASISHQHRVEHQKDVCRRCDDCVAPLRNARASVRRR